MAEHKISIVDAEYWVPPKKARELLSIGNEKLYKLINSGVLVSNTKLGPRSRRISVASIREYMAAEKAEAAE